MKPLSVLLLSLFIAAFAIDTLVAATGNNAVRYLSKGALILLLLAFFIVEVKQFVNKRNIQLVRLVCLALFFSFVGDLLLIDASTVHFIAGLASFLAAHIFYILFFYKCNKFSKNNRAFLLLTALFILCYVIVLNYLFWPQTSVRGFVIPVIAYSIALGLMLFMALNTIHSKKVHDARKYFIYGAVSFIASDSMLAFNLFFLKSPLPGYYIMTTYCLAQLLIVVGALKAVERYQG